MLGQVKVPTLSVVMPWCDRPELRKTFLENFGDLAHDDLEVLIVNCGGDIASLDGLAGDNGIVQPRIIDIPGVGFNKSRALNIGVAYSRGEILFLFDADIAIDKTFFTTAAALPAKSYLTLEQISESPGEIARTERAVSGLAYNLRIDFADGSSTDVETRYLGLSPPSRSAPGNIALRRSHFLAVGGLDSGCRGWGWEDLDLIVRLKKVLDLEHLKAGRGRHHTYDEPSEAERVARSNSETINFGYCLSKYALNNFSGTFNSDIATASHVEIFHDSFPKLEL